ncbi:MAG: LUD domain-containing protein, partial [Armatimonadetes bacterium]|nr:LUD domain-containing protein [Anaerolineae bacterium]
HLLPDFETWLSADTQGDYTAFRAAANLVVVSGPSKTADIAQELIKGAHGPREVHIIILLT